MFTCQPGWGLSWKWRALRVLMLLLMIPAAAAVGVDDRQPALSSAAASLADQDSAMQQRATEAVAAAQAQLGVQSEPASILGYFDCDGECTALSLEFSESTDTTRAVLYDLRSEPGRIVEVRSGPAYEHNPGLLTKMAEAVGAEIGGDVELPAWFAWLGGDGVWAIYDLPASHGLTDMACSVTNLECLEVSELRRRTGASGIDSRTPAWRPVEKPQSVQASTELIVDAPPVRGEISQGGEVDRYTFTVTQAGMYEMDLDASLYYSWIELGNDRGEIAWSSNDQDDSSIYFALGPGTYWLKIGTYDDCDDYSDEDYDDCDEVTGSYRVSVRLDTTEISMLRRVAINDRDGATPRREVQLDYRACYEPDLYMASESADFADATWLAEEDIPFVLSEGYGLKRIYMKVKNIAGVVSEVREATIEYVPCPELEVDGLTAKGFIEHPGGENWFQFTVSAGAYRIETSPGTWDSDPVRLELRGPDDYLDTWWSDDDDAPPQPELQDLLEAGTYFLRVRAGDVDATARYGIRLSRQLVAPTVTSFMIKGGQERVLYPVVMCQATWTGQVESYLLSESPTFAGAEWLDIYHLSWKSLPLSLQNGTKTVYFKVRDRAGVESAVERDTIRVDTPLLEVDGAPVSSATQIPGETQYYRLDIRTTTGLAIQRVSEGAQQGYMQLYGPDSLDRRIAYEWSSRPGILAATLAPGTYILSDYATAAPASYQALAHVPFLQSVTINQGAAATMSREVTLSWISTVQPGAVMVSESPDFAGATWMSLYFNPDRVSFTLPPVLGNHTIYLKARYYYNGPESYVLSDQIELQAPPAPRLFTVSLNDGRPTTTRRDVAVRLFIGYEPPTEMLVSESPGFEGAQWEPFVTSFHHQFSEGYGIKRLYVKLRSYAGQESPVCWDEIGLEPPFAPVVTRLQLVLYGRTALDASVLQMNNTATGDPTQYIASELPDFSDASWRPYHVAPGLYLSYGSGTKVIYFKVRNEEGMESAVVSRSIEFTEPAPLPVTLTLNWGSARTKNPTVYVSLPGFLENGGYWMMLSESPTFVGATWQPYKAYSNFTFAPPPGPKTLYAKVFTPYGRSSAVTKDQIQLDQLTVAYFKLRSSNGATTSTEMQTVELLFNSAITPLEYIASEPPDFTGAQWQPYNYAKNEFVLSEGDGLKTVYLKVRHSPGFESPVVSAQTTLIERATPVKIDGPPVEGSIGWDYDADWFAFDVAQRGTYRITLRSTELGSTELRLYGPGARSTLIERTWDSPAEDEAGRIERELTPGHYDVLVPGDSWDTGRYTLSVTRIVPGKP